MAWIKKHLKKIIGILVVLLILVGAYWYGGNAPGSRGFGRPGTTSENTESTTQEAVSGEASDTEDADAEISDDAEWDDSSSSGQGSTKKNHSKRDTKKDDEGSEKDKSGIVTPDYSATTQEHKNGDTDVSEDPGTDSSQSTDNKTPSNGGGSSKKMVQEQSRTDRRSSRIQRYQRRSSREYSHRPLRSRRRKTLYILVPYQLIAVIFYRTGISLIRRRHPVFLRMAGSFVR